MNKSFSLSRVLSILFAIVLSVAIMLPSSLYFSFALENENGSTEAIETSEADSSTSENDLNASTSDTGLVTLAENSVNQTPSSSHSLSAQDIKKYGYYKGKNATRIPILTYHQIVSDKEKKSEKYRKDPWTVSQSAFNKQMRWLYNKHYRTINCDEFYLWYTGKIRLPKRSVLITFDDGNKSAMERSLPLLKRYKLKATHFIIGRPVHMGGNSRVVSETRIRQIMELYPNIEFQSHTYNLHYKGATSLSYAAILGDARTQRDLFGFDYLAYPYGRKTNAMIKAYKDSGIRMAFSFSDYGFATRRQNKYKIKRLAVKGNTSFRKFKKWCR